MDHHKNCCPELKDQVATLTAETERLRAVYDNDVGMQRATVASIAAERDRAVARIKELEKELGRG